jgi:hypothetical protein
VKYRIRKKRGVNMPATVPSTYKGKKQPDIESTASLKKDKLTMVKIMKGRKEARKGKTYSWDNVFSD